MRQPHPRLLRAIVVLIAATLASGAFTVFGWTGPDEPKAGPTQTREDATIPGPDDTPDPPPSSVPAVAEETRTFSCPDDTSAFHNPVLHYRLCYPRGWGFSDFAQPDRLERIQTIQLENLRLLSSEAFPWRVGAYPFDVAMQNEIIDVELNLLQKGTKAVGECDPAKPRSTGDLTVLTCTQTYDAVGQPADAGPVTAVKFIVPLLRPPSSTNTDLDLTGSRLLVIVRTATARALREVDLGWSLVRSIRPY